MQPRDVIWDGTTEEARALAAEIQRPNWPWVRRRIQTLRVLNLDEVERRTTLDVDVTKLPTGATRDDALIVPLSLMSKGLYPEFDVTASDGRRIPVTTSDEDSQVAYQLLRDAASSLPCVSDDLPWTVNLHLYRIVHAIPSAEDKDALERLRWDAVRMWQFSSLTETAESERLAWQNLLADQTSNFFTWLRTLSLRYVPCAILPASSPSPVIVKLRIVEPGVQYEPGQKRIGLEAGRLRCSLVPRV